MRPPPLPPASRPLRLACACLSELALALALLGACAYQPVKPLHYRAEGEGRWAQGLHLVPSDTRPLDFTTAFVEIAHNSLPLGSRSYRPITFLVIAANLSSDTLTVDPAAFRAVVAGRDSVLPALDPELVIRDAHARMTNEDRRWVSDEAARGVLSLLDLAAQAATALSGRQETEAEVEERRAQDERIARHEADALRRHELTLFHAAALKARWSEQALRKTTLLPGQKAWGMVSFANENFLHVPQGLVLQFPSVEGGFQDIGRYGLVEDTLSSALPHVPAASVAPRPTPAFNKP